MTVFGIFFGNMLYVKTLWKHFCEDVLLIKINRNTILIICEIKRG